MTENTTIPGLPPGRARRWYYDACGAALAMELIGERWSIFIVRELMFGARRFNQLRADLPGISANILTQRLDALEAVGVVNRRMLPPPASVQVYELTEWGYAAEPMLLDMCRWALRSPAHTPLAQLSPVAMMLSLKALFAPDQLEGAQIRVGFRIGDDGFTAQTVTEANGARLDIRRSDGSPADSAIDCCLIGSTLTLRWVFYGGRPIREMMEEGALQVTGNVDVAERLARAFPFPDKLSLPPLSGA